MPFHRFPLVLVNPAIGKLELYKRDNKDENAQHPGNRACITHVKVLERMLENIIDYRGAAIFRPAVYRQHVNLAERLERPDDAHDHDKNE